MLEALRKQTKLIIWIIIGSFLATVFIAWGMHFAGGPGEKNYAAKIGSTKISNTELNNSLRQWSEEYRQTQGQLPDEKSYENTRKLILNNMIYTEVLYKAALKAGIKVSKVEIDEVVKLSDIFKNQETGQFDQARYMQGKKVLPKSWWTEQEKQAKRLLLIKKLESSIKTGAMVTDEEAKEYYKEKNMSIKISFVPVLFGSFGSVVVSEEELVKYYDEHKDEYEKPDQVKAEYLEIAKPSEQDIADSGARSTIIANLRSTMEKALEELNNGVSIKTVSSKYSIESAETPFIDRTKENNNPNVILFTRAAFTLSDPGELTNIIETENFYYIIKLIKRIDAYTPELTELRSKIEKEIRIEKQNELAKTKAQTISAKIRSGSNEYFSSIKTTPFFEIEEEIPGLGKQQEIKQAVFDLLKNQWSEPIKTENGYYVLKLDDIKIPDVKNISGDELVKLKDELAQVKQYQIAQQWFANLQKTSKIVNAIYPEEIKK